MAVAQEVSWLEVLAPSVRELILGRLAKLKPPARQLVQASAVLGTQATAQLLWQVAELEVQAGIGALEEAVRSGMLREEEAGGPGAGRLGSYPLPHDLIREVVYPGPRSARRLLLHHVAPSSLGAQA